MARELALGLDQGTGSSRAVLLDRAGKVHGFGAAKLALHVGEQGLVEQDAEECLRSLQRAVRQVFAKTRARPSQVVGVGLACQRSTSLAFAGDPAKPLGPAISWQCTRTRPMLDQLPTRTLQAWEKRSGLVVQPHYAATKYRWLLDHLPKRDHRRSDLVLGTLDSFLLARLADDGVARTDLTQAHRTLLVALGQTNYDARALRTMDLDEARLPIIVPTLGERGLLRVGALSPLPAGVPLVVSIGDQQAALFGAGMRRRGQAKVTYGTGAFVLAHAGTRAPTMERGVLRSVAWSDANHLEFLLETNVPGAGSAIGWWERISGKEFGTLLQRAAARGPWTKTLGPVRCVPGFAGLGPIAPGWTQGGAFHGLDLGTDPETLALALSVGVASVLALGRERLEASLGRRLRQLVADGGGSRDPVFLAIQADVLRRALLPAREAECTGFGAAALVWQALEGDAPAVARRPAIRPRLSGRVARKFVDELRAEIETRTAGS